jgi:murein peptide amidase A
MKFSRKGLSQRAPTSAARTCVALFALCAPLWAWGAAADAKPAPAKVARSASAATAAELGTLSAASVTVARDIDELCSELGRRLADLSSAMCAKASLKATQGRSVHGTPIFSTDVVPQRPAGLPSDKVRRRVLVIGGIHGDELSSVALAFHWLSHANEPDGAIEWRFVPLINPDSVLTRKPQRMNANGVDLNRNFPTPGWDVEAPKYWEARTKRDPRRYPGAKPLSEPESRWLHDEMERFKPNLIVSIHAPYGVLDFDGPTVPPQRLGRLYLDQVGIYPGSLGNYGGVHKRVPVVTIELNNAHRTPTPTEMRQMWLDMLRWIGERIPE